MNIFIQIIFKIWKEILKPGTILKWNVWNMGIVINKEP
jgi:hypothetical protein